MRPETFYRPREMDKGGSAAGGAIGSLSSPCKGELLQEMRLYKILWV